jgi:hypothetical protein
MIDEDKSRNFSYEQMNISFSNPGCDSNSNFYNLDWSNQFDFLWPAQATENYAPQFQELYHSDYRQFNHQAQPPVYQVPQPAPQSLLEDMMKALIQTVNQSAQSTNKSMQEMNKFNSQAIQKLKNATIGNSRDIQGIHQAIAKIE